MISKEIHESVYNAANAGDLFRLKELLEEQADIVNSQDDHGFTALHGAVEGDSLLCVSFLLWRHADPMTLTKRSVSPLHICSSPDIASLLVACGASLEAKTLDGSTPLILVTSNDASYDVMEQLILLGADVNAQKLDGKTALDIAHALGDADKMQLLISHGATTK